MTINEFQKPWTKRPTDEAYAIAVGLKPVPKKKKESQ